MSEAGRTFLPEARAVLAAAQGAAGALDDLAGLRRGHLRLAASQTVATYWLPTRMARFAAQWPGVALSLTVGNTQDAAAAVLSGAADIGVVEGEVSEDALHRQIVGQDRLGLYARCDHPLAGKALDNRDLRGLVWVLREAGSGTRAALAEALAQVGVRLADLDVALALPSNGAALEALSVGGLVTVVSDLAAASRLAAGQIVRLDWPFASRHFTLLTHRARRASKAARAFIAQ